MISLFIMQKQEEINLVENNSFVIDILGAIDQKKTQKQVNSDIKQLEKTINMLRLTGTFANKKNKFFVEYLIKGN